MADFIRAGTATWPGMLSCDMATYSVSHGISASLIVISMAPQPNIPAMTGDFAISDGVNTIIVPGCRVVGFSPTADGNGLKWQMHIEDRRWRWRECERISGCYNQPDPTGQFNRPPPDSGPIITDPVKYIPWTIRTPAQLAALCLDKMGERNYEIHLPVAALPTVNWDAINPAQALSSLVNSLGCHVIYRLDTDSVLIAPVGIGADLPEGSMSHEGASIKVPARPDSIVLIGSPIKYQGRFILEPVGKDWDGQIRNIELLSYAPAAKGIIAQWALTPASPVTGDVLTIEIVGFSTGNPFAPLTINFTVGATATVAAVCAGVTAAVNASGWATSTGGRAVNGGYLAPPVFVPKKYPKLVTGGSLATTTFYYVVTALNAAGETVYGPPEVSATPAGAKLSVKLKWSLVAGATGYNVYRSMVSGVYGASSLIATTAAGVAGLLDTGLVAGAGQPPVTNTATVGTVTLYGPTDGSTPDIITDSSGTTEFTWTLLKQGRVNTSRWNLSAPPSFANVVATNRLTREEAQALARNSVFKMYRILNLDVETHKVGCMIQGFGRLLRTQQAVLLPDTLDPTFPFPGDPAIRDGKTGEPITRWNYDGVSRDRPARVYGSYNAAATGTIYGFQSVVTDEGGEVMVPFHVDPKLQLVVFGQAVYQQNTGMVLPAALTLETSMQLRDPTTNAIIRTEFFFTFPGPQLGTGPAVIHHDDVETLIAGRYEDPIINPLDGLPVSNLTGTDDNLALANAQANYYLLNEAIKYQLAGSLTRGYNGIELIWMDGAVQQVSWTVGGGGARTTASRNSEHLAHIPKYPQRLRIEYLAEDEIRKKPIPPKKPRLDKGVE